jgi:hypothetical protein
MERGQGYSKGDLGATSEARESGSNGLQQIQPLAFQKGGNNKSNFKSKLRPENPNSQVEIIRSSRL